MNLKLEGAERAASLARNGDGQAVRFDGGCLEIVGPSLDPPGAVFTLVLRVCDPTGRWDAPLFGSYGGDGAASLYLRGADGDTLPRRDRNMVGGEMATPAAWMFGWPEGPRAITGSHGVIECIWGAEGLNMTPPRIGVQPKNYPADEIPPLVADTKNAVLRVMFPMEPTGPRDWHDVVVRGTGPKLELWIDGVLVDVEFPIGVTRPTTAPRYFGAAQLADGKLLAGFHGLMDHAALWHRALDESEIAALSGGAELAHQRELVILGPQPEQMQYFHARGHNSKAGDCIPFFHDGTFHLFYLVLRRNMHSKWNGGHGALEVHHASTKDLLHWQHHPIAVPISEQWEAWNGTGAVVHHDGKFWMFYPCPDYDSRHGGIQLTTSEDGIHFTKQEPHPFLRGNDCEVFPDPDPKKKLFHLIQPGKTMTELLSGRPMTTMAHLVSEDLKTWRELPDPFILADEAVRPGICPNWFRWNDWYYFIGGGNIAKSQQPFGPWKLQEPRVLDAVDVPKTGAFTGNRRLFAGFLADGGYGGNLVLRELLQQADGTLGMRFVPEMIPPSGEPLALKNTDRNARLEAKQGRQQMLIDGVPNDTRITLTLAPQGPVKAYGLRLRTTDCESDGTECRLTPQTARANFSASTHSGSAGQSEKGTSIEGLQGLDQPLRLDIICRHDLLDVELNGRRTLINRFWNPTGNRLGIWVEDGALLVHDVTIRPLLAHTPPGGLRPPEMKE